MTFSCKKCNYYYSSSELVGCLIHPIRYNLNAYLFFLVNLSFSNRLLIYSLLIGMPQCIFCWISIYLLQLMLMWSKWSINAYHTRLLKFRHCGLCLVAFQDIAPRHILRTLFFVSSFEQKFGNSLMVGRWAIAAFPGWSRAEASNQNFLLLGSRNSYGFHVTAKSPEALFAKCLHASFCYSRGHAKHSYHKFHEFYVGWTQVCCCICYMQCNYIVHEFIAH